MVGSDEMGLSHHRIVTFYFTLYPLALVGACLGADGYGIWPHAMSVHRLPESGVSRLRKGKFLWRNPHTDILSYRLLNNGKCFQFQQHKQSLEILLSDTSQYFICCTGFHTLHFRRTTSVLIKNIGLCFFKNRRWILIFPGAATGIKILMVLILVLHSHPWLASAWMNLCWVRCRRLQFLC